MFDAAAQFLDELPGGSAFAPVIAELLACQFSIVLVAARLSGMMTAGPLFGRGLMDARIRVLLVAGLSVLIAPAVAPLTEPATPNMAGALAAITGSNTSSVAVMMIVHQLLNEFLFGLLLGLAVTILLAGVELAGELLDRQSGLDAGAVFDPATAGAGSLNGKLLMAGCCLGLLMIEPFGLHEQMLLALFDSFDFVPPGQAFALSSTTATLSQLIHQSLSLGLQIAAPVTAALSLVAIVLALITRSTPHINPLAIGFPFRIAVNLVILMASVSGMLSTVVDAIPRAIPSVLPRQQNELSEIGSMGAGSRNDPRHNVLQRHVGQREN